MTMTPRSAITSLTLLISMHYLGALQLGRLRQALRRAYGSSDLPPLRVSVGYGWPVGRLYTILAGISGVIHRLGDLRSPLRIGLAFPLCCGQDAVSRL